MTQFYGGGEYIGLSGWPARQPPSVAMTRVRAAIESQAAKTVRLAIISRARAYALHPEYLDLLRPGFQASAMTPGQLIAFAKELLWQESRCPQLWPVPVRLINARAAVLTGRYRRALANRP